MHLRIIHISCLFGLLLTTGVLAQVPESAFERDPWPAATEGPVQVFILAGQSNMQGHASLRTLEYLIYNEETAADYQQWKNREGRWSERRDVWVWTTDGQRSGNLRPGFGANEYKIGPELGFGWTMGEHLDAQVLLIKTCWGGRSVRRDFLPPGAAMPSDEQLELELENGRRRNPDLTLDEVRSRYGLAYRDMISHVHEVLANLEGHFPGYDESRGYELAGFVWFQGWNDMVDGQQRSEQYRNYTQRLGQLIRDVRNDLDCHDLPAVIGELGVGGEPGDFQAAQKAVTEIPDLDNVRFVETHQFWEPDVAEMAQDNVWRGPDWVRFYNVASDRGYHYLGSGRIQYRMGSAFAEGMLELLSE